MIYCPECGTANRDGSNFCNNCGRKLLGSAGTARCPMCGAPNTSDAEMCAKCGARIKPLRVAPEGTEQAATKSSDTDRLAAANVSELTSPQASFEPLPSPQMPTAPEDWLQKLRMAAAEKEISLPAEEPPRETKKAKNNLSDWLQKLAPTEQGVPTKAESPDIILPVESSTETSAGDMEKPSDSPLPEWLRAIVASEEPEQADSSEPKTSEDTPSWLQGIVVDSEPQSLGTSTLLDTPAATDDSEERKDSVGDLLSWLLQAGQEESSRPAEQQPLEPSAPIPLSAEPPDEPTPPVEPAAEITATPADVIAPTPVEVPLVQETNARDFIIEPVIPDWLRQTAETAKATAQPVVEEEEEIPDWLRSLVTPEQPQEQALEPLTPLSESVQESEQQLSEPEKMLARPEIPDWLRELAPKESLDKGAEQATPSLAKAEIPDWLEALRPAEKPQPQPEVNKITEGSGLLAGIRGVLPVEMVWALPRRAQASPFYPSATGETGPVALFAEILGGKPEKRAVAMRRKGEAVPGALPRLLMYLLLIAVILSSLFLRPDWLSSKVIVSPPARDFAGAISGLAPNSTVLVAFDYEPASAAELDLQAVAVLRHILETHCSVLALSLTAQGPALAEIAWGKVSAESAQVGRKYKYGQDFLNLGYLPAQEAGLRALLQEWPFAQDFAGRKPPSSYALTQRVKSLQQVALVVVLSGEPEGVRRWLEQVKSTNPIKMIAGVSAYASPAVAPYYPTQLTGILSGLPGAAEYELALNRPGFALAGLGAQSAAHAVVILVIVLGNLALLASQIGKRK